MTARALIIGAPRSGSGKTSVTIGLLRALSRRGVAVRGAKSGPDYIDPGFHAAATGRPGVNLDSWAMPPPLLRELLARAGEGADLVLVESAMGLFDGIPAPHGRSGAAADLARLFGIPVLLVLDVSGQSQTAAAIAKGFYALDPAVKIAGVVLNRVASERHRRLAGDAVEALGIPVVGAVMRDPALSLPERHLGLVQAEEHADLSAHIDRLADTMTRSLDLDRILGLAMPPAFVGAGSAHKSAVTPTPGSSPSPSRGALGTLPATAAPGATALPPPAQRIAVARDAAFTFLYPHLIASWREAGAELVTFSPLADEPPPTDCGVCWLPGGYPELHAGRLAAAEKFRAGMTAFAAKKPIHGECGGFMVLGRTLEDADGKTHRMLGLLGHSTSFAQRKMNLGYREAALTADTPIGAEGTRLRGHEFHYARVTDPGRDLALAELFDGEGRPLGPSGARRGNVTGTFFHVIALAER